MIQIMMCDDDQFILQLASQQIQEIITQKRLEAQIQCVTTESSILLKYVANNPGEYLFFLDLDFGSGRCNGIDVARSVKQISPQSKIVFVTNHQEMAMQVLFSGVEPFGFLEKTTDMAKLRAGYGRYIQMAAEVLEPAKDGEEQLILTVGIDEEITIGRSQICYVEAEKTISHGVTYHTLDGSKITVRDTIEHISEMLEPDMIRVHRSILAARKHMLKLSDGMLLMANGEEIPCAVRMRGEVRKCLQS